MMTAMPSMMEKGRFCWPCGACARSGGTDEPGNCVAMTPKIMAAMRPRKTATPRGRRWAACGPARVAGDIDDLVSDREAAHDRGGQEVTRKATAKTPT